MNRKEELLRQAQQDLAAFVEERLQLEGQLAEQRQVLTQQEQALAEKTQQVEELQGLVEQLRRLLFGPKSERLTEEQEGQLATVLGDLAEQKQRPTAESDQGPARGAPRAPPTFIPSDSTSAQAPSPPDSGPPGSPNHGPGANRSPLLGVRSDGR